MGDTSCGELRLPDVPGGVCAVHGYVVFSAEFIAYVRACRGANVFVYESPGDTVRIIAKPGRSMGMNERLFGPELHGSVGEPSGWHVVAQTGNYAFYVPGQRRPPHAFPLWRCRYSHGHACGSLGFTPLSCCVCCAHSLARRSLDI